MARRRVKNDLVALTSIILTGKRPPRLTLIWNIGFRMYKYKRWCYADNKCIRPYAMTIAVLEVLSTYCRTTRRARNSFFVTLAKVIRGQKQTQCPGRPPSSVWNRSEDHSGFHTKLNAAAVSDIILLAI
jgi:hypothetical protein